MQNLINQKELHVSIILACVHLLGMTYVSSCSQWLHNYTYVRMYTDHTQDYNIHIHIHTHTYTNTCTYIYVYATYTHAHTYIRMYVRMYTHTHVHAHTHVRTHTHHLDLVMQQWVVKHLFLSITS